MSDAVFVRVASLFPDRSGRWVNETCRRGGVPGAVKIGGAWYLSPAALAKLGSTPAASPTPTVEDAEADLRSRGVL